MNEPTQTETPKPKKKRSKSTTPRPPRVIEPEIAAINEAARKARLEHRKSKVSARILRVIIEKRIGQLTQADIDKLADLLQNVTTAPLPIQPAEKATL